MTNIYFLYLENDKYYVGRTDNLNSRIDNHFNNIGSMWTKKYKPIKIIKIIKNCDYFDEDKYTIKLMAKYGINNVRGGSFTRINLTNEEKNIIQKMINNATNRCFNCYSQDHFLTNCPNNKIYNADMITLKLKIIDLCHTFDSDGNGFIEINDLIKILIDSNYDIFNGISNINILALSKKMNIPIDSSFKLNFIDFVNGLILFLDQNLTQ